MIEQDQYTKMTLINQVNQLNQFLAMMMKREMANKRALTKTKPVAITLCSNNLLNLVKMVKMVKKKW